MPVAPQLLVDSFAEVLITMLSVQEPYKSIFKAFKLYGFRFKEISFKRKVLAVMTFIFCLLFLWIPCVLSLLQATDKKGFLDRSLMAITSVSICLKAIITFKKMDKIMDLVAKIHDFIQANQLENDCMQTARKTALRLAAVHTLSTTFAVISAGVISIYQKKFIAPIYTFDFMTHGTFFVVSWMYVALGAVYTTYLSTILDILPTICMIPLPGILQFLNVKIENLEMAKKDHKRAIVKCLNLHGSIKE